jgi:hypothetical protein
MYIVFVLFSEVKVIPFIVIAIAFLFAFVIVVKGALICLGGRVAGCSHTEVMI